jgi:hypothetical protein
LVWDISLNNILWKLHLSLQYKRLANSIKDSANTAHYKKVGSTLFRHTLFTYLAHKLAHFPRISSAFSQLASEEALAGLQPEMPETELIAEFCSMERMLMFYHEAIHAVFSERLELRDRSNEALRQLLTGIRPHVSETELWRDIDTFFPEFRALTNDERFSHFAEELNCDFQAFVLASMILPNAPGLMRKAWQDSIGMLFGAGMMLSTFERVLKLAVSKWQNFAGESSDGEVAAESALMLADFISERPLFFARRWNCIVALQAVLSRLGTALSVDAFEWQPYVMAKSQGMVEALEEHAVGELNSMATLEFIAKVIARSKQVRGPI